MLGYRATICACQERSAQLGASTAGAANAGPSARSASACCASAAVAHAIATAVAAARSVLLFIITFSSRVDRDCANDVALWSASHVIEGVTSHEGHGGASR